MSKIGDKDKILSQVGAGTGDSAGWHKLTHKEQILALLRAHKRITMGMLFREYPYIAYSARNRICELKQEGYDIQHYNHDSKKGEHVSDNAYILIAEPKELEMKEKASFDTTGQGFMSGIDQGVGPK